jgi:hypothetical protein
MGLDGYCSSENITVYMAKENFTLVFGLRRHIFLWEWINVSMDFNEKRVVFQVGN